MICIEDCSQLLPTMAGKVVGIASYRGEWLIVACERGLFRLWDDGIGPRLTPAPESERGGLTQKGDEHA